MNPIRETNIPQSMFVLEPQKPEHLIRFHFHYLTQADENILHGGCFLWEAACQLLINDFPLWTQRMMMRRASPRSPSPSPVYCCDFPLVKLYCRPLLLWVLLSHTEFTPVCWCTDVSAHLKCAEVGFFIKLDVMPCWPQTSQISCFFHCYNLV